MKIKICGLTDPKEAAYLNTYQADFAGFILFYPGSKRNNTIAQAKEIMRELAPSIKRVAVAVSPTEAESKGRVKEITRLFCDFRLESLKKPFENSILFSGGMVYCF